MATTQPPDHNTVLITGASTGIGAACARTLDRQGWRVFAGVRQQADAEALRQESSPNLTPVFVDVTRPDMIQAAAQKIGQAVGQTGLTGLVNNAGIARGGPLEFVPIDEFRAQLEVNVIGQLAVTQACLPLLRQGQGRIVNISSISGRVAAPFVGPYAASKFALEALTDSLRVELGPWAIDVISIQPGVIKTPIWHKGLAWARQQMAALPQQGQELYGDRIDSFLETVAQSSQAGLPPEAVANVVLQALTASRPKTRYLVGRDAKLGALLVKILPDRLRDWFIIHTRVN